jgi:hypothetical protein
VYLPFQDATFVPVAISLSDNTHLCFERKAFSFDLRMTLAPGLPLAAQVQTDSKTGHRSVYLLGEAHNRGRVPFGLVFRVGQK